MMFTDSASRRATFGNRRLLLVDIENMIGGAAMTRDAAEWGRSLLTTMLDITRDEQVIVGTCTAGLLNVGVAWGSARIVTGGSGPDAADKALIDVMADEDLAGRYSEIVLVSGDHGFAPSVRALRAAGVPVTVASWRGQLSPILSASASRVLVLEDLLSPTTYTKAA